MGGAGPVSNSGVTAQDLLEFMVRHNVNDNRIFEILCGTLNKPRYLQLLGRIDRINSMQKPARQPKVVWEGRKNRVKGKLFELLIDLVLRIVEPFTTWKNINTSTSEIDLLVQIGPTAMVIPALREWGTHFVCECKFSHDHVSIQWITNLGTVLQTHNSSVGLLFTSRGTSTRGNGARAVRQIEMLSVMMPARFVICLNSADLHACGSGVNFLRLVSQRYMEVKANVGRLRLLAG